MPDITVEKIHDAGYEKLKQRAVRHRRSLNSEIIYTLKRAATTKRIHPDIVRSNARRVRDLVEGGLSLDEIQDAIDAGRP